MEPRRRKDDERGQVMKFIVGVLMVCITGWIGWVSICAVAYDKRISVTESVITYIQSDIKEVKELVKDIRNDQVRRERRENGK
jgi:hypothetical protein